MGWEGVCQRTEGKYEHLGLESIGTGVRSRIKLAAPLGHHNQDESALESFSPCVIPFTWPRECLMGLG